MNIPLTALGKKNHARNPEKEIALLPVVKDLGLNEAVVITTDLINEPVTWNRLRAAFDLRALELGADILFTTRLSKNTNEREYRLQLVTPRAA